MASERRQFDVVVVGSGPAGMAAARAAAVARFKVALVDENPRPGGQIWRRDISHPKSKINQIVERRRTELTRLGVVMFYGTTVVGADGPHRLFLSRPSQLKEENHAEDALVIETDKLILATGARERFLPFEGWTRPGVYGAGGLQALVKGGFDISGKRVVVAGTGPLLIAVAVAFQAAGAKVEAIVEQVSGAHVRSFGAGLWRRPRKLLQAFGYLRRLSNVRRVYDAWPIKAVGIENLESVILRTVTGRQALSCDLLACGFGLVPETRLAALLDCKQELGVVAVDRHQETSIEGVFAVGEPCGIGGLDCALIEGEIAGLSAIGRFDAAAKLHPRRDRERQFAAELETTFRLRDELKDMPGAGTLVCRCEDVCFSDIEGFSSAREAKLATRVGMGSCQARVCGPALKFLCGWNEEPPRMPLSPVSIAALGTYAAAQILNQVESKEDPHGGN